MRITIVGMGSIGQRHFQNLILFRKKYGIDIIKAFEKNKNKISQLKKKFKNYLITDNFKEAIKGADVVYICSPTNLHIESIKKTLKYITPHFYIEKPLSSNINSCKLILSKIKKTKKKVGMGYMLHNHPVITHTKKILEQKTLGKVLSVRAESGFYLPFWHPSEDYRDFYMSSIKEGGGALLDTSHEINYLQYFFGAAEKVSGKVQTISDLEITSDDLTLANIYFKNKVQAQVHLDLLQFDEERYFKIIASKAILIGDLKHNTIKICNLKTKQWKNKKFKFKFDTIYHTQLKNFMNLLQNKKANICDTNSAYHTMEIVEAIRKSSNKNSQIVKVNS
tara:strand:- start:11 stop:1018 length:1008 start_codon:yes stop_codon:yes gene_type:complete